MTVRNSELHQASAKARPQRPPGADLNMFIRLKREARQICTPYREVGDNADEPESAYCLGCGGLNDEFDTESLLHKKCRILEA